MPIYEFKCKGCQKIETLSVSLTAQVITPHCFECKQEMSRVFSLAAVKFNGSGFYQNDK